MARLTKITITTQRPGRYVYMYHVTLATMILFASASVISLIATHPP
jgi:hypothetical protein